MRQGMERQPLVTLVPRELTGLRGGTLLMCRPGCKVQQLPPDELPPRAPEALALGGGGEGWCWATHTELHPIWAGRLQLH